VRSFFGSGREVGADQASTPSSSLANGSDCKVRTRVRETHDGGDGHKPPPDWAPRSGMHERRCEYRADLRDVPLEKRDWRSPEALSPSRVCWLRNDSIQ